MHNNPQIYEVKVSTESMIMHKESSQFVNYTAQGNLEVWPRDHALWTNVFHAVLRFFLRGFLVLRALVAFLARGFIILQR